MVTVQVDYFLDFLHLVDEIARSYEGIHPLERRRGSFNPDSRLGHARLGSGAGSGVGTGS